MCAPKWDGQTGRFAPGRRCNGLCQGVPAGDDFVGQAGVSACIQLESTGSEVPPEQALHRSLSSRLVRCSIFDSLFGSRFSIPEVSTVPLSTLD
jgi:hypothetical protein